MTQGIIDETSAWLGALFAVSVILTIVVAGGAFLAWTCRAWIAALLRNFSDIQLQRSAGKITVSTSFAEDAHPKPPELIRVREVAELPESIQAAAE